MTAGAMSPPGPTGRAERFAYLELDIDPQRSELRCRYSLDDHEFVERVHVAGARAKDWARAGVEDAARWVFLFLGVSYYKAAAPPVVDLRRLALSSPDVELLRKYYVDGLAELAYRNGLDLSGLEITGPPAGQSPVVHAGIGLPARLDVLRPLVPFGGGIDSIVTTELVRSRAGEENTALFILSKAGDRYAAIETAAAATGIPVLRAERELDEKILRSEKLGYLNGHVPVTGMISAIAVLTAVLHRRDSVVMSNEESASQGNVVLGGRVVNHQWSKGLAFETGFRSAIARHGIAVDYFSLLRSASELWVAQRFAALSKYHRVFRSCNRSFYIDAALRLDHWCGECDKCCFVDLVLAPFMGRGELEAIFDGREPLSNDALADKFRALVGLPVSGDVVPKPFECVGDVAESRAALRLAATRSDRDNAALVHRLLRELPDETFAASELLHLSGPSFVPDAYAPDADTRHPYATGDLLV